MKSRFVFLSLLLGTCLAAAPAPLVLKNEQVSFVFDSGSGALQKIAFQNAVFPVENFSCTLIGKNGEEVTAVPGETFRLKQQRLSGAELHQTFTASDWELEVTQKLFPGSAVLARDCRWKNTGDKPFPVKMVKMMLTIGAAGDPKSCFVTHPSRFPSEDSPFSATENAWQYSGGGHMPGSVLYQRALKLGLSYTMHSVHSDFAIISGTGKHHARFSAEYNIRTTLKPGDSCEAGTELVSLGTGSLGEVSATLYRAWEKNGFRLKPRPEWTRGAVIYSAYVQGSRPSFRRDIGTLELFRQGMLPHLQDMGIDILWLNPFNEGGYSCYSFDIDPAVGTKADLKRLTEDAKARGIRVLLDLVIHGPSPRAKQLTPWIIQNHPDWISRNENGKFKFWWGGYSMDYANPEYQDFAAKIAAGYLRDCGISGWRVDCARRSPDNERPTGGRIPSQSWTEGALKMMHQISKEIREVDPEGILLGETHTTVNLSEMEFIYDELLSTYPLLMKQKPSVFVPALKKYFARDNAAFPAAYASGLMRHSENHDTPAAVYRYGSGQRDSLLGLTFLVPGIPLVNMGQERGAELLIRKLVQLRRRPEFLSGEALYEETGSSNPSVFTFTRYLKNQFSTVAVNFCGQTLPLVLELPEKCEPTPGQFCELVNRTPIRKEGRKLFFTIQPYQTCVIAFAPEKPSPLAVPAVNAKPLPSKTGKEVLENRFWKVAFSDGFPVSVRNQYGREIVPEWHWVADHFQLRWKEIDKDLGKTLTVTDCSREKKDGAETLTFSGKWSSGKPFLAVYTLNGRDLSVNIKGITASEGALEFTFGSDVSEWFASALEGSLHGNNFPWHVAGDEFILFEKKKRDYPHLLQKSGLIYESSVQVLHPRTGQIALKKGNFWTGIRFSAEDQKNADDIILREQGAFGRGLTVRLSSRSGNYSFRLRSDDAPQLAYGWLKKGSHLLVSDGPRHTYRNNDYEFTVYRNQGGSTGGIQTGARSQIIASRIFSDDGFFFPKVENETGELQQTIGSSAGDQEAGMRIAESDSGVELEFCSRLKKDDHCQEPALPQTDCRILWQADDHAKIRYSVIINAGAVLPYQLRARGASPENLKGTLRQEFTLADFNNEVKVRKAGKILRTIPLTKGADGVLFQTGEAPDELTFYGKDGKLNFRMADFRMGPGATFELVRRKEKIYLQILLLKAEGRKQPKTAEFSCNIYLKMDRNPESDELNRLCHRSLRTSATFRAKMIGDQHFVRCREAVNDPFFTTTEALTELRKLKKEVESGTAWPVQPLKTVIPFFARPPVLDGKISPGEWDAALRFDREYPIGATAPLSRSNAVWYLGYDQESLSFAARIAGVAMQPGPAGKPYYGDSIELFLHPDKRLADYLETVVGCDGQCYQANCSQSLRRCFDLDPVAKTQVKAVVKPDGSGYCIEGKIPFAALPGYLLGNAPNPGESMNFMLICCRLDRQKQYSRTTPYPFLYDGHNIYGYIQGTLGEP